MWFGSSVPEAPNKISRYSECQNKHIFVTPMGATRKALTVISDEEKIYQEKILHERAKYVEEQSSSLGYMSGWIPKFVEWLVSSLNIPENTIENFEWINLHCFHSLGKISRNELENDKNWDLKDTLFPISKIYEILYKMNEYLRINWLDYDENPKYEETLHFCNSATDQTKAGKFLSCLLNLDKMYFVEWWNVLYCYDGEFFISNSKTIDFAHVLML